MECVLQLGYARVPSRKRQLWTELERQLTTLRAEVRSLDRFAGLLDEHGDEKLEGVAAQITLMVRHITQRLDAIEESRAGLDPALLDYFRRLDNDLGHKSSQEADGEEP